MNDIELHMADCLTIMYEMGDAVIDLTVTSPPYDTLRSYNGMDDWNDAKWQSVIAELYRVTKNGGVVVWIVGDAVVKGSETGTSFKQALWAMDCGFRLHDTMIWAKDTTPFPMSNRYDQAFEYMFIWSKGAPKTVNLIADKPNKYAGTSAHGTVRNPDGSTVALSAVRLGLDRKIRDFGSRLNYWMQPTEKNSKAFGHPAMFPVTLAQDHIVSWSNPGDVVFDPFMGSGTTGKAAYDLGRNFIGVERDETYFAICSERLDLPQHTL